MYIHTVVAISNIMYTYCIYTQWLLLATLCIPTVHTVVGIGHTYIFHGSDESYESVRSPHTLVCNVPHFGRQEHGQERRVVVELERLGEEWRGEVERGGEGRGVERRGEEGRGGEGRGEERRGEVRWHGDRRGEEGRGEEGRGAERLGEREET